MGVRIRRQIKVKANGEVMGRFFYASERHRLSCGSTVYLVKRIHGGTMLAYNRHYALLGNVVTKDPRRLWRELLRHPAVDQRIRAYDGGGPEPRQRGHSLWFDMDRDHMKRVRIGLAGYSRAA